MDNSQLQFFDSNKYKKYNYKHGQKQHAIKSF